MGRGKNSRGARKVERKAERSSSPYILDRNLTPRIEEYALNHDITDVDDVVDHLRRSYREYQRKQLAALRQMVVRAVQSVQQRGVDKPELQLQARESTHLAARQQQQQRNGSSEAADESEDSSEDEGEDDEDEDEDELDAEAAAGMAAAGGLNSSLLDMYGGGGAAASDAAAGAADDGQQQQQQAGGSDADGDGGSSSGSDSGSASDDSSPADPNAPPAFAPPHVVAAAAARALAAEKAQRAAAAGRQPSKQQQQPGAGSLPQQPPPPAAAAAAAAQLPPVTPAAGDQAQQQQLVGAGAGGGGGSGGPADSTTKQQQQQQQQRRTRSAEEAGIAKDSSRAASKRARRSSGAPGGMAGAGGGGGGGSRKGGSAVSAPRPVHYADLGGVDEVLADIQELIEYPLKHPEVYRWLGVEPPRGVLLHGPPGCGKTALAHAIATECGVPFLRVSAPEVVSGMSGESEARLRQLFQEAVDAAPSIIFIDEIDAIAPKRDTAQREMERRIVAQMLTCMDDLAQPPAPAQPTQQQGLPGATAAAAAAAAAAGGEEQEQQVQQLLRGHVVVIGATNRPDALDPALRRAGRFDREISLGIPTEAARRQILAVLTRPLKLQGGFDFAGIARKTPGFVGADLAALTKEAAAVAVSRIFSELDAAATQTQMHLQQQQHLQQQPEQQQDQEQHLEQPEAALALLPPPPRRMGCGPLSAAELSGLAISMSDFEAALPKVQPSVRREGFTTKPDATWDDVGSLEEVREELAFAIAQPIAHPEAFAAMGLSSASGVLLYGPPGCGKTLVAKAVAAQSGANFISIKGPELLNKYVGESERAVRQLFARARAAHPCVLFFDEMDALAPRRGSDNNAPAERLVNQLLTEMDGIDGRVGVYVVAATNRPDMIDPALLRPGRLDKVLFVPLPPPDGRSSILAAAARRTPMGPGVLQQAQELVRSERCEGFSGADVAALVKEAAVLALKEGMAAAMSPAPAPPAAGAGPSPSAAGAAAAGSSREVGVSPLVHLQHFEAALASVSPSVSKRDRRAYEAMRTRLRGARAHLPTAAAAAGGIGGAGGSEGAAVVGGGTADGSRMDADAAAGGADAMEGTDDAPAPTDPMKDD